jgi:hypothetical protein
VPDSKKTEAEAFPVDTLRDATPHFRRPFSENAVRWKVQATWPKGGPTGALIVPYIDARLVIERLNLIIPDRWTDDYKENGATLWCHLTVDGVTHRDLGEGYVGKGLVSDAFKRAAVKFGIGVSLYAMTKITLNKADGLADAQGPKGPTLKMTGKGEARCRDLYRAWLAEHGIKHFGQPLDHGDAADAVGDTEAADEGPVPAEPPTRPVGVFSNAVERGETSADDQLRVLLAVANPLQPLRHSANRAMEMIGASPRQRLRELQDATNSAALEGLVQRASMRADEMAQQGSLPLTP